MIKEDNFSLFGRDWVAEFDISPHNLKLVDANETINYPDKLQSLLNDFFF